MRSSKDLAKRLRFELRPRRYAFRRLYFLLGAAAAVAAIGGWFAFSASVGERQYLPGPTTSVHASFGDRCQSCHAEAFGPVADKACRQCHQTTVHSAFETRTPACLECHVEHRGLDALRGTSEQPCIACHAELQSKRTPVIATRVADFSSHPEFVPLRAGASDPAALRFNHKLHLGPTTKIPDDRKLDCPSCHVVDEAGERMQPIVFEAHCRACHAQGGLGPLGNIEVPHEAPDVVRRDLQAQLLAVAVANPQQIFGDSEFFLPGRSRGPIDQSRSLNEYLSKWTKDTEAKLYSFDPASPLEEHNKYCFLCHLEGEKPAGEAWPGIVPTAIERRWLARGEFSHDAHAIVRCEECHTEVRQNSDTARVNLPGKGVCQRCHLDGGEDSAGAGCPLCHVYHAEVVDRAVEPTAIEARPTPRPRGGLTIDALKGIATPFAAH